MMKTVTSGLTTRYFGDLSENELEQIILIGDDRIRQIPVADKGEDFVNLTETCSGVFFDDSKKDVQRFSGSIFYARKTISNMLEEAARILPDNYFILLKECYRPLSIQTRIFNSRTARLKGKYPEWTEEQIYDECCRLTAPPDVGPHPSGAAVDLTLVDSNKKEYDMGTILNAQSDETKNTAYTFCPYISDEAKKNRSILIKAMTQAGFVNYPTEWWHWSYGDRYWAFQLNRPHALYGSVDGEPPVI